VSFIDSFVLTSGREFGIINVGSLVGSFQHFLMMRLAGTFDGLDLLINYHAGDGNDVKLFTAVYLGDINRDGAIDGLTSSFRRYSDYRRSRFECGSGQDGFVNGLDVAPFVAAILSGGGFVVVAEPSTLALATVALLGCCAGDGRTVNDRRLPHLNQGQPGGTLPGWVHFRPVRSRQRPEDPARCSRMPCEAVLARSGTPPQRLTARVVVQDRLWQPQAVNVPSTQNHRSGHRQFSGGWSIRIAFGLVRPILQVIEIRQCSASREVIRCLQDLTAAWLRTAPQASDAAILAA